LILGKIIKIIATRCQILRLKCTKFDFDCGSIHPRPRWWRLQPIPPIAEFKGAASRQGGEGDGMGKERQRDEEGCEDRRG